MKSKSILLLIGAIASVGMFAGTANLYSANAQTQTNPQQSVKKQRGGWAALNLTDAQKAQIKQVREQTRAQIQAVFTPDQLSKLQAAKGQRGERRNVMASLGLTEEQKSQIRNYKKAERDAIMNVLTPEQQQQIRSMHQSRQGQ